MVELPQIVMLGRPYFFDRRLRQLRRRDNPHDAIDLSGDESETLAAIIADSARLRHPRTSRDARRGSPCVA